MSDPTYDKKIKMWEGKLEEHGISYLKARVGNYGHEAAMALNAVINDYEQEQRRLELQSQNTQSENILAAQKTGNKIQFWILLILLATLLVAAYVAFFKTT